MNDQDLTPEISNGNQKVNIGGLPVELSPQLLQALSSSNAVANLNPMADVMAIINEPRGALLPMAFSGIVQRAKTQIQIANVRARRQFMEERNRAIRAVTDQITATAELADTLLRSGTLSELQKLVLSMQFPRQARAVQREDELTELQHQVSLATAHLKLERLHQRRQPKDPRAAAEERLNRARDEALLALQHRMQTAAQFVATARAIRDQINHGQFSEDEHAYLENQLQQLLAQLHLDQHSAHGR
jgi:hypothetical protein